MRSSHRKVMIVASAASFLIGAKANASESATPPGLPGSSVPSSATPGTSLPSASPTSAPLQPTLSAPSPKGSPSMSLPAAPPAFTPGILQNEKEPLGGLRAVRGKILGKRKRPNANGENQPRPAAIQQQPEAVHDNSIDSFFQLPGSSTSTPANSASQGEVQLHGPMPSPVSPSPSITEQRSAPTSEHHGGRFLYHLLDNIGVPLPADKSEALDPSLRASPPSTTLATKNVTAVAGTNGGAIQNTFQLPQPTPAAQPAGRIPESELEGVELPAPRDVQRITP